jgi:PST family polysaccharide transporter
MISVVVLARLLPRESYGVMAMALTVMNLAFVLNSMGISTSIIRLKELSERLKVTLYWCAMGVAVLIAVVLIVIAYPIALAYKQPELTSIICALAMTFPIVGLGVIHQALLERDSDFRKIAILETTSTIGGLVIALGLAWAGFGVWALVFQMLGTVILNAVQLNMVCKWRPQFFFDKKELHSVLGFSADFSLFQFIVYFERNADSMIIGRLLGSAVLGVYSMAYKVMLFPLQNIATVASRAVFPALSRLQHSPQEMGALFLRSTSAISLITAPMMAGMFFLRVPFVELMFGDRWSEVADVLKWLAAVGFIQTMTYSTGPVFVVLGRSRLLLWLGIYGSILQVGAFFIGVGWGIEGVAASYFVANFFNLLPPLFFAISLLGLSQRKVALELSKPLLASAFMMAVMWAVQAALARFALPLAVGFWIGVVTGALAYLFALVVILRQNLSDLRSIFKR